MSILLIMDRYLLVKKLPLLTETNAQGQIIFYLPKVQADIQVVYLLENLLRL